MGTAAILEAIRAETEAELARIDTETAARVAEIRARAEAEASEAEALAAASRDAEARRERAKIVNRARLAADRRVRVAAEDVYQGLLDRVTATVASMRNERRYRRLLADFLREALAVLPEARTIQVDSTDAATMESVVVEMDDDDFIVEGNRSTAGGLVLSTADGRAVNNTVESRLARADLQLRRLASELVPPLTGIV